MKDIAKEIAELRKLPTQTLVARYKALYGKEPRSKRRDWLWKKVAWKIQEQRRGGQELPALEDRKVMRSPPRKRSRPGQPAIGTTLVRRWHDQEIRVQVLENGFEWEGVVYRSLSAVAKAVTNQHWSGPFFFNLRERKKK